MGDATNTNIGDGDAAQRGLTAMGARAEMLGDKLKTLSDAIIGLESAKPWGNAEEYGGKFEEQYFGDKGGAPFVRDSVHLVVESTRDGAETAYTAIEKSIGIDQDGARLFADAEEGLGQKMAEIKGDREQHLNIDPHSYDHPDS